MKFYIYHLISITIALTMSCSFTFGQKTSERAIQQELNSKIKTLGLSKTDLKNWMISDSHQSFNSDIEYIYLQQTHNNIPLHNAIIGLAVKDEKIHISSNTFTNQLSTKVNTFSPTLTEKEAIISAAEAVNIEIKGKIKKNKKEKKPNITTYEAPQISREEIPVQLKYFKVSSEEVRLVWDLSLYTLDQKHWWSIRIDALSGEILEQIDWVVSCDFPVLDEQNQTSNQSAKERVKDHSSLLVPPPAAPPAPSSYNVFPYPVESPLHGERQLISNPSNSIASPYGWHSLSQSNTVSYTDTRGNNVFASDDPYDNDMFNYAPDGGTNLNFDFPFNESTSGEYQLDAAITQLFYANNALHDIWYQYGFDEPSGNFQYNNYGNGGYDEDMVYAQAQDGGGMNNANFATPPDGYSPQMQMYLWQAPSPEDLFTVNYPSDISGNYPAQEAGFGPDITDPITADVIIYDGDFGDGIEACEEAINASEINGKIAIIRRGGCFFDLKVHNAEAAGAIAAIIINNVSGAPVTMGNSGEVGYIGIPSVMISLEDGNLLVDRINNGETVNVTLENNQSNFYFDSDFDNGVIAHEYGHGISIRLTGGANQVNCLWNEEQMGEGWSDWFALMSTMEEGDQATDPRGIGSYLRGDINGGGIRLAPYSTDFAINDYTYGALNNESLINAEHDIGFVWCTMLWDLTWAMVDKHGFDSDLYHGTGGNNMVMNLVITGLKLQPCSPGFVDGRNAILLADELLYNGANQCLIWQAFANRGVGYSASQGSSDSRFDQHEAFDLPTNLFETNYEYVSTCESSYTWSVTAETYSTGGNYEVNLTSVDGCDSTSVLVLSFEDAFSDYLVNYTAQEDGLFVDQNFTSYQWVDCNNNYAPIAGATQQTFYPENNGSYAVIVSNGTCSDTSACHTISILGVEDWALKQIKLYPNPTKGEFKIDFGETISQATVKLYTLQGEVVQITEVSQQKEMLIDIIGVNGIYLLEVTTENGVVFKERIIKQD